METITKKELAAALAEKEDLTQKAALQTVNDILNLILEEISKGNEVDLAGFGKFSVKDTAARTGYNPSTKRPMKIAAGKGLKFTAKKALKDAASSSKD